MKTPFTLVTTLLLFLGLSTVYAQQKFELADYAKLVHIRDPQLSPDGKQVVILVGRPDYGNNRLNTEMVLVDIISGTKRVLTQDRVSVNNPRWSPDGKQLAFISKTGQGKEALNQIFILPMQGGEAKQITKAPKGVQHFEWSPNGAFIAYAALNEPKNKAEIEKGYTGFEIGNNDMFISSKPLPSHLWLVNTTTFENKRLTNSDDWTIQPSTPFSWSPDSKTILFVKAATVYTGDRSKSSILLLNITDSIFKPLTNRATLETAPMFSPDGNKIVYWYKKDGNYAGLNELWLTDTKSGEGKPLSALLSKDLNLSIWMPDNKSMLIGGHNDNKTSFWILNMDGKTKQLDLGTICPTLDASVAQTGAIVFTASEPNKPVELYYMASANQKPIQLTDFNAEISKKTLGKTETLRWENDGFNHCGIVTYPANYKQGQQYPLVMIIHGGPNAASLEQFTRLSQIFANEGYFVFEPNYRGSDNQGAEYKVAIVQDAGAGPGRDIMAGLEKLKTTGMVDTTKIGVSGWSYGGYMTVWLSAHYKGWKAAVAGAAVTDWVDQYSFSDINITRAESLGGSPFVGDNMQKYITQSSITEAKNIKAPTLILANTGDPRVPITQSYKLYHTLTDNGTVVKFWGWPAPAHNAADPVTQVEQARMWVNWMNTYLK